MNRIEWCVLLAGFLIAIGTAQKSFAQYDEKYRPRYHLSARNSSMADPKGLFFFNGYYHIYWYGEWEHAVSTDLVHWQEVEKPMKGAPRKFSYFSGSVLVDKNNTGGFGNNSTVAVYTMHFPGDSLPETQAISVSKDGGFQFFYYDKNPVLDIGKKFFRDPQVFWHDPSQSWKMVVALSDQHQIPIYESKDLKNWQHCSTFGELGAQNSFWECPDFFELVVLGTTEKKWVMIIGRGPNKVQYFVGEFDGKTFTPDSEISDYLKYGKGLNGIVYDDFETERFTKWKFDGDAFLAGNIRRDVSDYLGLGYACNLSKNSAVGKMRSKPFTIHHNTINFLIAGAQNLDSLGIRLVINGKVCRTATGDNTKVFRWSGWDVRDLKGKKAHLEIIDLSRAERNGAIALDHILFSDNLQNLQVEHALWMDYGDDFYASRTYRNYDEDATMSDSVILLSWLGNWKYARSVPSSWGTGFQSVPRVVALKQFPEGIRMVQQPIRALKTLRGDSISFTNRMIKGVVDVEEFRPEKNSYEIEAVFSTSSESVYGLNLLVGQGRRLAISYDPKISSLCVDRSNCTDFTTNIDFSKKFATKMYATVEPEGGKLKLHIFVDQSSVEVFTNQGKIVFSTVTYPSESQTGIQLFSEKGQAQLLSLKAWKLSSIWETN